MKLLRFLLINLAIVYFNVSVNASPACASQTAVRRDVATFRPVPVITEMNQAETEAFLRAYNAMPPATAYTGDSILIISNPNVEKVVVVTFGKGCAIMTFTMPRAFFMSIFKGPVEGISL